VKLSIRQQALLIVLLYAAIFFIAFAISKTLLYVFVFSLISILVVNFIYKNLLKIKIPHPISVTLSLIIYFGVLVYAFVNIIPLVVNQIGSFYEFMKKILDSKYWENYLVDNPELSKVIGNLADWASPRISELFNNFLLDFAKKFPGIGVIIFYSILFTVYVTIYTKWTTKSLPGLFPKRVRPLIEDFLTKLGNSLQSYVDVILLGALIRRREFLFPFHDFPSRVYNPTFLLGIHN